LGGVIFYQYSYSVQQKTPEVLEQPLKFDREAYEKVLKEWQERNERFQNIESKEYTNSFE